MHSFISGKTQQNLLLVFGELSIPSEIYSNWARIDIGITLSQVLLDTEKEKRTDKFLEIITNIIQRIEAKEFVVENIDILFSPEFKIDVLKLLIQLCKNKRAIVIWNGTYQNGVITYAEPNYKDFHRYEVKNYDILCVMK